MASQAAQRVPPSVALVTGGRRGIGSACAIALAEGGSDIVIVDLEPDAEATLAKIEATGRRAVFITADIADVPGLPGLGAKIFAAFGRIDCLVNAAGVLANTRGRDLLDATPDTFDRVMNVNLRGTFFFTQEIARRMVAAGEPADKAHRSIITITSGAVGQPQQASPEYAFSKTGLSLMSQAFAVRLGPHGIHTYEVRPGVTKTEMSRDVWEIYEALVEQGRFPIARMGLPEDVGQMVANLAAGAMPYSTGDYFHIDGGFHLPFSGAPGQKVAKKPA